MVQRKVSAAGTSILLSGLFISMIITCRHNVNELSTNEIISPGVHSLFSKAEYTAGSDIQLSTIYLNKARLMINQYKHPDDYARYHLIKGRIYYYQDDYSASISHIDTAITIFRETQNLRKLAKAYFFMESTQSLIGNYPAAIQSGLESIKISTQIEDHSSLAISLNSLSNLYLIQEDYLQALSYSDQAFNITIKDSISLKHANVISTKGKIYKLTGDLEKAEDYLFKAYNIRIQCAEIRHIASSMNGLAELFYLQNRFGDAKIYLNNAKQIYLELQEKSGLFNIYITFTKIFIAEGEINIALQFAEKAMNIGEEVNSLRYLSQASLMLYEVYEKKNDPSGSLEYYIKYNNYHNQLLSLEKIRLIANHEYQYELQKKTTDNEILIKKNKVKQLQIIVLSLFSVILVVIAISVYTFFHYKNKTLESEKIISEKQRVVAEVNIQLHRKEKIMMENDLELKNKELTSKTIELMHQVELLQSLAGKIENIKNADAKKELDEILIELNMKTRAEVWDEFHKAFNKVHNDYYKELFKICPDLSSTDINIAALLKLNLSTKEIAAISYKSESAVKTARHRLRQKLNLGQDENLINYLLRI